MFFNMLPFFFFLSLALQNQLNTFVCLHMFIALTVSLFTFSSQCFLNGDISNLPATTALWGHLLEDFGIKSINNMVWYLQSWTDSTQWFSSRLTEELPPKGSLGHSPHLQLNRHQSWELPCLDLVHSSGMSQQSNRSSPTRQILF